jgi:hypothetical protein
MIAAMTESDHSHGPAAVAGAHDWLRCMLRFWLLRPIGSAPAGDPTRAVALMALLWLGLWLGIDRWLEGPEPQWYPAGIPLLAWYGLAILALAGLLRWRSDPEPRFAPVLALVMGIVPLPLLFAVIAAASPDSRWLPAGAVLASLYMLLYFSYALRAITGARQRTAAGAGVVFVLALAWLSDRLDVIPDVWQPREAAQAESAGSPVDAEELLFTQSARIDAALAAVHRAPTAASQAFFLGFAGVGEQKVFAQEIGLAARVLSERYDIGTRRVDLVNDQRDLEAAPLATLAGLKYALRGLAARMNLDRDVLFVSISSHGSQDASVAVSNSDLPLDDLTDEDLAEALSDSGIKWRVIVISACYSGSFIESLRTPQTIVITASAADRTSFGCSNDRDLTYFGEAFYRDALPEARSLHAAFDAAKAAIDRREHAENITASNPQAYFGVEIEAKLAALRPGGG